jgi:carbon storage regulator
MLLLSRKLGERILVPDCKLAITVVEIKGNAVRLGISAPPEVAVYREEVLRQCRPQMNSLPPGKSEAGRR